MQQTGLVRKSVLAASMLVMVSAAWADDASQTTRPSGQVKAPATRQSATTKPSRPARHTAARIPASANAAIQELRREYEQGNQRRESDYFEKSPDAEMSNDVVVTLLTRRLPGMGNAMQAYVKWQLLSAMPKEVPTQYVQEMIGVYRQAPGFEPRPGILAEQKRRLDRVLQRTEDGGAATRRLNEDVARVEILNRPAIAYRDDLFARLPDSFAAFEAALGDLLQRGEAGLDVGACGDTMLERIRKWVETADSAHDLDGIYSVLDELRYARLPTYYDGCHYDQDKGMLMWDERSADLDRDGRIEQAQRVIADRRAAIGSENPTKRRSTGVRNRGKTKNRGAD